MKDEIDAFPPLTAVDIRAVNAAVRGQPVLRGCPFNPESLIANAWVQARSHSRRTFDWSVPAVPSDRQASNSIGNEPRIIARLSAAI